MFVARIDDSALQKALKEVIPRTDKSATEVGVKTLYEIGKIATTTTKSVPPEIIESELRQTVYGDAPRAAILVNARRAKDGKSGLYGQVMANAVERYIRLKKATRRVVLAGWLTAVRKLEPFVKNRGAKPPTGRQKKIANLGGAIVPKLISGRIAGLIYNTYFGGKAPNSVPSRVTHIQVDGVQQAIDRKTVDLHKYAENLIAKDLRASGFKVRG